MIFLLLASVRCELRIWKRPTWREITPSARLHAALRTSSMPGRDQVPRGLRHTVATAPSPIFELVAHSSQMAIFVICNEHGGESVTALTGFTAVLVGGSAGTDGSTDGAAEASSSRPRSDGAKLRDKPTTVRFRGPRATSDGVEHLE
jgi:hypothetical protein